MSTARSLYSPSGISRENRFAYGLNGFDIFVQGIAGLFCPSPLIIDVIGEYITMTGSAEAALDTLDGAEQFAYGKYRTIYDLLMSGI